MAEPSDEAENQPDHARVRDFTASLAFYRDGPGFPPCDFKEGQDFCMFALKSAWLTLYPWSKLAEDATAPHEGAGFTGIAMAHNPSSREAVDVVFHQAIAAGATLVKLPDDAVWGGYSGYFADPGGHLWEVAYNPFIDLT